jgi:hypothetical protein
MYATYVHPSLQPKSTIIIPYQYIPCHIKHLESRVSNKSRYGSSNVISSNEGHDSNHSKTSIIELTAPLPLKNSRVNIGEVELGENNFRKGTSLGVMNSLGFGRELSDEDGSDDLSLSSEGNSLPCIKGVHFGERLEGNIGGEHTWEMKSCSLNKVSGGGKHGNTRMLELGSTEPVEGGVISDVGNAKGIEVFCRSGGASEVFKSTLYYSL